MPSAAAQPWQEKASGFFSSSGEKLKEARETAGSFVEEVAKDAKINATDVAERVGSMVKSRWAILRQPATRRAVQESLIVAAANTGTLIRKGVNETKDKVAIGKIKVEEVAKKTAEKSKTILTDIERWQKGVASTDVFGAPIEATVERQQSNKPVPQILINCVDYLILSGLKSPDLFKTQGNKNVIQQLVAMFNQDPDAALPELANPINVAALTKYYIASLPEPLITFDLYYEVKGARASIPAMRNILKKLPIINYMTLEFVTALFLRVSKKSAINKMDARSLSMEMAPVMMWQKGRRSESYREYWSHPLNSSRDSVDPRPGYNSWDMLSDEGEETDASSPIPLDDGMPPTDFGAIDVIQCLINHHYQIFDDANEMSWR